MPGKAEGGAVLGAVPPAYRFSQLWRDERYRSWRSFAPPLVCRPSLTQGPTRGRSANLQFLQLRLDLEEIAPRQLLVRRRPEQIGRMQRRHRWDGDARCGRMQTPVAAQAQDAVRGV